MLLRCPACELKTIPLLSTISECHCSKCNAVLHVGIVTDIIVYTLCLFSLLFFIAEDNLYMVALTLVISAAGSAIGDILGALLGFLVEEKEPAHTHNS